MSLDVQITGKLFARIAEIGQDPAIFEDYTQAQIESDEFARVGLKKFEIAASILDGITDEEAGKAALVAAVKASAESYLPTILTDSTKQYVAKVYVLSAARLQEVLSGISQNDFLTGEFVPKDDNFDVQTRIDVRVVGATALANSKITQIDATNFEVTLDAINDLNNEIVRADVNVTDLIGNAAIPESISMTNPVVNGLTKSFTYSTLTFEDPNGAAGQNYGFTVQFFDALDALVSGGDDIEVTVEGL